MRNPNRVVLAVAACASVLLQSSFASADVPKQEGAPGTKSNPIVATTKVLRTITQHNQKTVFGDSCFVRTFELELSAPGIEPQIVVETQTFCDDKATFKGGKGVGLARPALSPNVNQYPPGGTCVRGQGISSSWTGSGTIEAQFVSYEYNNNFYVAYGGGIGYTMPSTTLNWHFGGTTNNRYYAATMRTSGALNGTGAWCG